MKLTVLGSGSPIPYERRAATGHLIDVCEARIIIDVGPGTCRRLLEYGRKPTEVTDILITHLHFDHVGELPTLLFYLWEQHGGIKPLPRIYGPRGLAGLVESLFGAEGAFRLDLMARTNIPRSLEIYRNRGGALPRPWPDFDIEEFAGPGWTEGDGWRIGHFPVLHAQPYLDSFGYRVESAGAVIGISSDLFINAEASYAQSLTPIAENAGILIHYLNHFDFDAAGGRMNKQAIIADLANRVGVKMLVTTHHGPAMDRAGVHERILADLASRFSGEIVWGEDLLTFEFAGGASTATVSRPQGAAGEVCGAR